MSSDVDEGTQRRLGFYLEWDGLASLIVPQGLSHSFIVANEWDLKLRLTFFAITLGRFHRHARALQRGGRGEHQMAISVMLNANAGLVEPFWTLHAKMHVREGER